MTELLLHPVVPHLHALPSPRTPLPLRFSRQEHLKLQLSRISALREALGGTLRRIEAKRASMLKELGELFSIGALHEFPRQCGNLCLVPSVNRSHAICRQA